MSEERDRDHEYDKLNIYMKPARNQKRALLVTFGKIFIWPAILCALLGLVFLYFVIFPPPVGTIEGLGGIGILLGIIFLLLSLTYYFPSIVIYWIWAQRTNRKFSLAVCLILGFIAALMPFVLLWLGIYPIIWFYPLFWLGK
jgi:hypothetical protein